MRHRRWVAGDIALLALVALLGGALTAGAQAVSARCEDYASQDQAQRAFDDDPARFRDLDNDGDGIACEHLFGSPGAGGRVLPWLLGGAVVLGLSVGVGWWLMRRRRATPEPTPIPLTAPEYDTGVEIELAALRAEERTAPGQQPGRAPDTSS